MKLFICCLVGSLCYVALADVKKTEEHTAVTSNKNNVSKPKRDASFPSSLYHGPSYKYLPPFTISNTYATYPSKVDSYVGFSSGGHTPGVGGIYSGHTHGHRNHGYSSNSNRNIGLYHSLDNEPTFKYVSGHHGHVFPSTNHYTGQGSGSTQFIRPGYKGNSGSHSSDAKLGPFDFSVSRPYNLAFSNGNLISTNTASGSGYHYTNGLPGPLSSPSSSGFQSADGLASSHGGASYEEHHGDHIHNGAQEHVYVVSNIPAGFANPYETKQTSVHQHPLPSTAGASFNTKYYSQSSNQGPVYATGHKGLGHFGFTANKPQVVHASLPGANFQQPSYSKAPFKASTFLGAKFEGSGVGDVQPQQYLPPQEDDQGSTGYDYPLPTDTYEQPNHHQPVEVQTTSSHEPDTGYLPPRKHQDSLYELTSNPSSNYLPPTDSFGNSYAH